MSTSIKRSKSLGHKTKSFFGLDSDYTYDEVEAWNQRRLKFCVNKFGNLNSEKLKSEGLDTSFLISEQESAIGNFDEVDTSFPASSWSRAGPRLNRTVTSISSRGYLVGSLLSPQPSTTATSTLTKKPHAFRSLVSAVSTTLAEHSKARNRLKDREGHLETIYDDEMIDNTFTSLKLESIPRDVTDSAKPTRRALNWSESLNERVRMGIRRMDVGRRFTDSLVGNFICCMSSQNEETKRLKTMIDDIPQYRPYFTYWVCMVHLIVFIAAVSVYGLAPIKLNFVYMDSAEVVMPSASIEQVCRVDYVNLFIGLRQADLIRLGARYSPCMRQDKNLQQQIIEEQKARERRSGCCIRNDGGGCYQTTNNLCSSTLATWSNTKNRVSSKSLKNVVCGLDPDLCESPSSIAPFQWDHDVVRWPICKKTLVTQQNSSMTTGSEMTCEVTGRPCCIGSKAECIITTPQHCVFLRGYYHPEAHLCSQINCLNEICGMLNFYDPEQPDQFYRLFTAIFLNSSIGSLVVTLVIQLTIMRDLEKMAGWHRIAILYLLSGMVGNLTSGIFIPYQVQCGASGSIFALIAMTFTEFLQSWKIVESPLQVLFKFLGLGLFLFLLGFLPFFDNYAHMSGLLSGVMLSFILLPFLGRPSANVLQKVLNSPVNPEYEFRKLQQRTKQKRLTIIIGCSLLWLTLTALCFTFFYWKPVTQCSWCKYFNCIPLDSHFCDNMDVNITTKTACVRKD